MNSEQKLKKIIGSKLSQAGFNPSQATDEILKLFQTYVKASDEKKAAVYVEGEQRIKNLLVAPKARAASSAPGKKVLHSKASIK